MYNAVHASPSDRRLFAPFLLIALAALIIPIRASGAAPPAVTYVDVADFPGMNTVALGRAVPSPDLRHVAVPTGLAPDNTITVDGVPHKRYARIIPRTLRWSPDSRSLVYVAAGDDGMFLVRDGQETRLNPPLQEQIAFSSNPEFSNDGKNLLWIASDGNVRSVFVDGQQAPATGFIQFASFWGPTNSHVYVLERVTRVIDSKFGAHPIYDTVSLPNVDESIAGYLYKAKSGANQLLVREDKTVVASTASDFETFSISPDAQRIVYVETTLANKQIKIRVTATGLEPLEFVTRATVATSAKFSPDSKRLIYTVPDRNGALVVVDGQKSPRWVTVNTKSLTWSDDSRSYAYAVLGAGKQAYVVRDNKKSSPHRNIVPTSLHFSNDASALAYVISDVAAGVAVRFRVVLNGVVLKPVYDEVPVLRFLPSNQLVRAGRVKNKPRLYVGKDRVRLDADSMLAERLRIAPDGTLEILTRKATKFRLARIVPGA
jgi:hypothetical protein